MAPIPQPYTKCNSPQNMDYLLHSPNESGQPTTTISQSDSTNFLAAASLPFLNVLLLLTFFALVYLTYKDYLTFLSLGRGGVPYNFYGYLFIASHRPFTLRSVLDYPSVPSHLTETGYLTSSSLSTRPGTRPIVKGIIPQRQITQQGNPSSFILTHACLKTLSTAHPTKCLTAQSCAETHSKGLFSLVDRQGCSRGTKPSGLCEGEVCHVHPFDGSVHVKLHPEDVKIVIEKGWGERHSLANGWTFGKFLEEGFMLIYAPRDTTEVEALLSIVGAGIGWANGEGGWAENAAECAREVIAKGEKAMVDRGESWDKEREKVLTRYTTQSG